MASDAPTLVRGAPAGLRSPKLGEVIGERYELVEVVGRDPIVTTFRGRDHESDAAVLVRMTAVGVLAEKDARGVADRLRPLLEASVGLESMWPRLLEVEREGALVATVEPFPPGVAFESVLAARAGRGRRFESREIVPLVARLAMGLDALPAEGPLADLAHGDLRAERVFVHPDGVRATGAFLLAALPGDAVQEVLAREAALRGRFAPEVADGMGGRAADRYAVAALVARALAGSSDGVGWDLSRVADAALRGVLERTLHPDPSARPATLRGLVDALSKGERVSVVPDPLTLPARPSIRPSTERADSGLLRAAKAAQRVSTTGTFQLGDDELLPITSVGPAPKAKSAPAASPPKKSRPKASTPAKPPAVEPPPSRAEAAAAPADEASRAKDRPRAQFEHTALPKSAELPRLRPRSDPGDRITEVLPPAPSPTSRPFALTSGVFALHRGSGVVLIAVLIAVCILGAAFVYRAMQPRPPSAPTSTTAGR